MVGKRPTKRKFYDVVVSIDSVLVLRLLAKDGEEAERIVEDGDYIEPQILKQENQDFMIVSCHESDILEEEEKFLGIQRAALSMITLASDEDFLIDCANEMIDEAEREYHRTLTKQIKQVDKT
jgi:hypothetical protein